MDEVYELIKKSQAGDKTATDMLVKQNIGLIWSVVKRFTNRGYEPDDLFQIGAIGLIKCINKFDTSFEVRFSTYAVPMIMGEIKRFIRDDGMIKISRPLKELSIKYKYLYDSIVKETGEEPTINELASKLNVKAEDLIVALDANRDIESLYSTVHQGDSTPIYLIDKVSNKGSEEETLLNNITLNDAIEKLKPKEKEVIKLRYFQDKTQTEVAKKIGVSQVQVSRIEKKVLKMMRQTIGSLENG